MGSGILSPLRFVQQVIGDLMESVHLDNASSARTSFVLVGVLIVVLILYYLCQLLWAPMDRTRLLGDAGYIMDDKRRSKMELLNSIRRQRVVGKCPPIYPNGWFAVLESRDLASGQVKHVSVLGLSLAVFRGEGGTAHVTNAHCPHLGANMAVGGQVLGDCLQCPFHGWTYRGEDGKCVHIPTADKIPPQADIKSYNTLEQNGFIHIWYHADEAEPYWTPPILEKIASRQWAYFGRTEHEVNAHIQEVSENAADIAHFSQLHSALVPAGTDLRFLWKTFWDFGFHVWAASWNQDPDNLHIGLLQLSHSIKLFGVRVPMLDFHMTVRQVGPGLAYLALKTPFGNGALVQCLTPKEPLLQRFIHHLYMDWWVPPFIAKIFLYGDAIMAERDIMIWNHKRYERKPVLVHCAEDQLIATHRRWYSQFYSDNSPKLHFQKNDLTW